MTRRQTLKISAIIVGVWCCLAGVCVGAPWCSPAPCKTILCWKRAADGTWSDPVEVVREDEFIKSFACTRIGTDAGIVLAWTCEGAGWVKVMIVKP